MQGNGLTNLAAMLVLTAGLAACGENTAEKAESTEAKPATQTTQAAADTAAVADTVTVNDPYIRAMPPGQKVTGMFLTIDNPTATAHELVKANSDVSETVELHEHKHVDGMMKMAQVPSIRIPANGSAVLEPGGYHIMLIGLQRDLQMGEKVDVSLTYDDGSSTTVQAEVRAINPQ